MTVRAEIEAIYTATFATLNADPAHQMALITDPENSNVNIVNANNRAAWAAIQAIADRLDEVISRLDA